MKSPKEIAKLIDYTNLKPTATFKDIINMVENVEKYGFYGICINPLYIKYVKEIMHHKNFKVITVVAFPLGAISTKMKILEGEKAIKDGVDELDIVSYIGYLLSDRYNLFQEDIESIVTYFKREYPDIVIKIIVDLPYITDKQYYNVIANVINSANPDFFKTSTGYAPRGTRVEEVEIFRKLLNKNIGIKAAGGIRSYKQVIEFIKAGASRIGTSTAIQIMEEVLR